MSLPASTPIYEEDDCCAKCETTERVGRLFELPICEPCYKAPDFKEWFMQELETALSESPDYERMSDGKWRKISLTA